MYIYVAPHIVLRRSYLRSNQLEQRKFGLTRVLFAGVPVLGLCFFIFVRVCEGAPLRLPKPLSDQFPVRVCSCPLCIINRL